MNRMCRRAPILAVFLFLLCGPTEVRAACPQTAAPENTIPHGDPASPGEVEAFALSPNAKWAAAALVEGTVVLWNAGTGEQQVLIECLPGWTYAITFSQSSDRVAVDDGNGTIHVLDVSGQKERIYKTQHGGIAALRFSPNGAVLAATAKDSGKVVFERLNGEEERPEVSLECAGADQLAFDRRGTLLAAVCSERTIRVWDLATQVLVQEISLGPREWVNGVDFGLDGGWLIAATGSGDIKVFDVRTGGLVRVQKGHQDQALLVRVISGDHILSESDDGDLRIWDLGSGDLLESHKIPVGDISADGKAVLSEASELWRLDLWSVQDGQVIRTLVYKPQ